jgi:ribosomal protein S18 acetylase RimI-like enzyme
MSAASIATRPEPVIRPATRADAAHLARFVDMASEGLARQFWAAMAEPGEDLDAVGARRAARDEGSFSWRNAAIAGLGGRVAGGMVSYAIGEALEPVDEAPAVARPLIELENAALGTWYVNVLATYPAVRGRGVASALLRHAVREAGPRALSLIVADGNAWARRLYEGFGFVERARRPIVKEGWESASRKWVLMLRAPG